TTKCRFALFGYRDCSTCGRRANVCRRTRWRMLRRVSSAPAGPWARPLARRRPPPEGQCMALNLYELFHKTARSQPREPTLLGPGADAMTYEALDDAIQMTGRGLRAAGVRSGDCVGLLVPSGTDYIAGTYAAWSCGACVVPIPVELKPNEKEEIFRAIAIDWVIARPPGEQFLTAMRRGPVLDL